MHASQWRHRALARIDPQAVAPLIDRADPVRDADGLAFWDAWPVQDRAGMPWPLAHGGTLWMALGAPRAPDPDERHAIARIHLIHRDAGGWRHIGAAMPDGFSPGSREWSGSAVADDDGTVTLYFTAAGRRGEPSVTFEQRLFAARCTLRDTAGGPSCTGWRDLVEIVERDPAFYMDTAGGGAIGTIKAFRDPAYFHDPVSGIAYLLFAGSLAGSPSAFNGVVGAAQIDPAAPSGWRLLPPIVSADLLNNELERPHIIYRDGLYYLFWSTQAHVFDPHGPIGPTGLYGMVSHELREGWRPLNGSGLVFANPPEAPAQAYSWLVLPDLSVTSFVDQWGRDAAACSPKRFGGTFAPFLTLRLDGETASLAD